MENEQNLLKILKEPNLLERIDKEFEKRIVGEKDTRHAIFLISCGRFVKNANSCSSNLLVNDDSGKGKDHITKNVLKIWSEGVVDHRERISPTAFTYMNSNRDDNWSWDDKIFYGEDLSDKVLNSDAFKVMASAPKGKEHISSITINNELKDLVVKGKPVMIITMAEAYPKEEMLRRFPIINCNGTEHQTRNIIMLKAEYKKKGINPEYDSNIIDALGLLKTVKVRVPYCDVIAKLLDSKHHIMRTNAERFFDYISFSAALFQYQRKVDENGYIIANKDDYKIVYRIMKKIEITKDSVPKTINQKKMIEFFKNKRKKGKERIAVTELVTDIDFIGKRQIYRELKNMCKNKLLKKGQRERMGKQNILEYELTEQSEFTIPTWEQVEIELKKGGNITESEKKRVVENARALSIEKSGYSVECKVADKKDEGDIYTSFQPFF